MIWIDFEGQYHRIHGTSSHGLHILRASVFPPLPASTECSTETGKKKTSSLKEFESVVLLVQHLLHYDACNWHVNRQFALGSTSSSLRNKIYVKKNAIYLIHPL